MERKLINYLPYQVREFREYQGITTGEQPEFELAWDAQEEVFVNQFVDTALDYGLSRWEKMLKIFPKGTDTLETRRARIKAKLNNFVPYTIRVLARMLTAISDGDPFTVSLEPGTYLLKIVTEWGASGQIEGLEYLINNIIKRAYKHTDDRRYRELRDQLSYPLRRQRISFSFDFTHFHHSPQYV